MLSYIVTVKRVQKLVLTKPIWNKVAAYEYWKRIHVNVWRLCWRIMVCEGISCFLLHLERCYIPSQRFHITWFIFIFYYIFFHNTITMVTSQVGMKNTAWSSYIRIIYMSETEIEIHSYIHGLLPQQNCHSCYSQVTLNPIPLHFFPYKKRIRSEHRNLENTFWLTLTKHLTVFILL